MEEQTLGRREDRYEVMEGMHCGDLTAIGLDIWCAKLTLQLNVFYHSTHLPKPPWQNGTAQNHVKSTHLSSFDLPFLIL
jgi:hypothetical protein